MSEIPEQDWLLNRSIDKLAGEFDNRDAHLIVDVADSSPAAYIGLSTGDYLVSINGNKAINDTLLEFLVNGSGNVEYQFYSNTQHTLITITTTRLPLGFLHEPSSPGIVARFHHEGFSGWADFKLLWERRHWDHLLEISQLSSKYGVIQNILSLFSADFGKSAEILFRGAALYELGDEQAGIEDISWFINNDLSNHESYTHAIAYLYASKWSALINDTDDSKAWLSAANNSNRGQLNRISQEVYLKGFEIPSTDVHWVGESFPSIYNLKTIDNTETHSLADQLGSMRPDELQPVCVMPSYRGNGPYNESMLCYRAVYKYFSHRLRPMHVLTDELEKRTDRDWWYENEEKALKENIPVVVLHDEDRTVADCLQTDFTPVIYVLNNKGEIVYEGGLQQPFDYWECFGGLSEQSKAA